MGLSLSSNLIKVVFFWQQTVMLKAASHRLASQWEATLLFNSYYGDFLIEAQANLNMVVIHFTNPTYN